MRIKEAEQRASLLISPRNVKIKVTQEVDVNIKILKAEDLFGAPFYLIYNPILLDAIKVREGNFLKKDGKKTAFMYKKDKKEGKIIVGLTRLGAVGGVSGDGILVSITFKALKPGRAALSLQKADFKDSHQLSLPVLLENGWIEVK